MIDQDLVKKLQILREIKPRKDWVILTKNQILEEEKPSNEFNFSYFLQYLRLSYKIAYKPVLISLTVLVLFAGTFVLAQDSLPGDTLYSLKRITEKTQAVFVSEEEKPQASLELVNKRLEELARVAKKSEVKNLLLAISETRTSISEANKNLAKASNPAEIKKIVDEIEKKAQIVSQTLGVTGGETEIGIEELTQGSDKLYLEHLISDLRTRTLNEAQEETLSQMEKLTEEGKYSEALIIFHIEFNKPANTEPAEETEDLEEMEENETEEEAVEEEELEE